MKKQENLNTNRKKALFVVTLAVFTDMFIHGMIVPILPIYAGSLGISQTALGFLFGSYALALLITTPIFGMISDKLGRRGPMLWGILGLAAATLLFAFANTFWFLLLALILQGCAAAITWTAGLALLADFYPSEERGQAMGIALSGQAMGILVGPSLGGWLYQIGGYMFPFFVAAGMAVLDGLLRLLLLKEEPHREKQTEQQPFELLRNQHFLLIVGAVMIGAAVPSALQPTLPARFEAVFHATPLVIGLLFAVPTIAYAVIAPLIGRLSTKLGHARMTVLGFIITALAMAFVTLPSNIYLEIAALSLIGIGMGMILAPSLPRMADLAQEKENASYGFTFAIYNTAYSVGMMMGPVLSGLLSENFGLQWAYVILAGAIVLYMMIFASHLNH